MATVTQPPLIPRPWASNGAKDTIPDTTAQFGRASWSAGFPSETAQPLGAGGIPPNWLDFQGVLHALSQHTAFEQVGGRYAWVNTQNYPVGACIIGSNGTVYQALQESGPGTSAGAKNPTTAANSAYWSVIAGPDGASIVLDANGRLKVSPAGIADGTTIMDNGSGKLAVGAPATATLLADGTTITANNGKLSAVGGGGGGTPPDGTTIIIDDDKLSVGAPATAELLADGITIEANNGKLSVVQGWGGSPGFYEPSNLLAFKFKAKYPQAEGGSSFVYLEFPFDVSNISASTISRYGGLDKVRAGDNSVVAFAPDGNHPTPYLRAGSDQAGKEQEIEVIASIGWWREATWSQVANGASAFTAILSPLPPMNFGSSTTANLSNLFSASTELAYLCNNLFEHVIGDERYTTLNLSGCFDGCSALANIPAGILLGISGFSGNVNIASLFNDFSVTWPMEIYIDSKTVNSASTMFSGHSGSGTMTFIVPAGSTTYTTLSTAFSGQSWVTVTGI